MQVSSNQKAQTSEPVLGKPSQARQNGGAEKKRKGDVNARRRAMLNKLNKLARAARRGWQPYKPTETGSVQSLNMYIDFG